MIHIGTSGWSYDHWEPELYPAGLRPGQRLARLAWFLQALPSWIRVAVEFRTAPFAYLRLHGPDGHQLSAGSYAGDSLAWWADRIREWERGPPGHARPVGRGPR